ncbi:DUF2255 family protein [Rhizomonospora bruguierae]|uniref:DUF2255 family protein n=1 Tax=Rhizomonospora bruguierae TaxID=1581705 RepID=UPI001BCB8F76|nr:DUF2255 family protein [Micromonospora sp. NBRC 107566]
MSTWTPNELAAIGAAEELQIAPVRQDGNLRRPTTIWVVPCRDSLYVRAANGPGSAWYRSTRARHEGHIRANGIDKAVTLTDVIADDPVNEDVDAAYRNKYGVSEYVDMILAPPARAATLRLTPR